MSAIKKAKDLISEEVKMTDQVTLDGLMERGLDAAYQMNAPDEVKHNMMAEWKGGKCLQCGKPFVKRKTVNQFANFESYWPDCECELTEEEMEKKRHNERAKLLMAGIPKKMIDCNFDHWDYGVDDETNTAMKCVLEYVNTAHFTKEGLVLYGEVGTGKTHCAIATLKKISQTGFSIHVCQMSNLVKKLINKEVNSYMDTLLRTDYVLFDDLDKVGTHKSGWVKDQVFNIFDHRTGEGKKFIATTNLLNAQEFVDKFSEAIASRLMGAAQFIEFKGKDYRQKKKGMKE
jgi:DNA replication protein DnaC